MSALSSEQSFYVLLTSSDLLLLMLLDSGSLHCFIDFNFAQKHSLKLHSILHIPLCLFDSSLVGMISFSIDLPVTFFFKHTQNLSFYITKLDSLSTTVLDLNWLTTFNLLVD